MFQRILERDTRARYPGTVNSTVPKDRKSRQSIFFFLAPSGRRDYALQDKARPLHRVAVKRCCLEAQPLPARLITDNGYNPAIDNRADVA